MQQRQLRKAPINHDFIKVARLEIQEFRVKRSALEYPLDEMRVRLPADDEERRLLASLTASQAQLLAATRELSNPTHSMLYPEYVALENALKLLRIEHQRRVLELRERRNKALKAFSNEDAGYLKATMDLFGEPAAVLAESRRNILEFIRQDINLGFTFLDTAKIKGRLGETQLRDLSLRRAQKACDSARGGWRRSPTFRWKNVLTPYKPLLTCSANR